VEEKRTLDDVSDGVKALELSEQVKAVEELSSSCSLSKIG
jgi:hypothetical protein